MSRDIRIALFLLGKLVAALRANPPDAFRDLLLGAVHGLGKPVATGLLPIWLRSNITLEEQVQWIR